MKIKLYLLSLTTRINKSKHTCLNWSAILFLFFGLLLALFVPEDITLDNTLIGKFCSMMSVLVPSIPNYAQISNFPNVTTVFFSVMWFLSLFLIPFMFLAITGEKVYEMLNSHYWKNLLKVIFVSVFSIIIFIGFAYLFVYMPVDLAEKVKPDALMNRAKAINLAMSHSRIGLAIYGSLLVLATAVFLSAFLRASHILFFAFIKFPIAIFNLFKTK